MKKRIIYSTLFGTILLLSGCAKEQNMQLPDSPEATLSLNISPRMGMGENEVAHVRVASFVPSSATSNGGLLEVNGGKQDVNKGAITQTLRTGFRDVYVIANEGAMNGLSVRLNGMKNLSDLSEIKLPYEPSILVPPFVCTYNKQIDIKKDANTEVAAAVVRTVSKVVLTIGYSWGAGAPLSEELVIDRVVVKNLPEYSYLGGGNYDGTVFVDSKAITGADLANTLTPGTKQYKSKPLTIYIPEFIGAASDKGKHAYVEIVGHFGSDATITNTYRIPIGDDMELNGTVNDYTITRNTAFTIDATIKSLGELNNIVIDAIVTDWSTVNSSEGVGEFLKVPSSVEIEYGEDFKLNIQASGPVTLTKTNANITITNNGLSDIKLRSDDMTTKVKSANYDIITVKIGKLSKDITVAYRPHPGYLMAKYNLTGDANGIRTTQGEVAIVFSAEGNYGSYFKYGSIIPIKCYQSGPEVDPIYKISDALWFPSSVTRPATWNSIPSQSGATVIHTLAEVRAGRGDPCRLIGIVQNKIDLGEYDNKLWRLPTIKELEKIAVNSYWRSYTEPPISPNLNGKYRYSDTFLLFFPFAGGRGDDGSTILTPGILHHWGIWQTNSMAIKSPAGWYDGMSHNDHVSVTYPGGVPPFVKTGGSPLSKGHSVRCIQQ